MFPLFAFQGSKAEEVVYVNRSWVVLPHSSFHSKKKKCTCVMLIGRDEKAQALVHPKSQIKTSIEIKIANFFERVQIFSIFPLGVSLIYKLLIAETLQVDINVLQF